MLFPFLLRRWILSIESFVCVWMHVCVLFPHLNFGRRSTYGKNKINLSMLPMHVIFSCLNFMAYFLYKGISSPTQNISHHLFINNDTLNCFILLQFPFLLHEHFDVITEKHTKKLTNVYCSGIYGVGFKQHAQVCIDNEN